MQVSFQNGNYAQKITKDVKNHAQFYKKENKISLLKMKNKAERKKAIVSFHFRHFIFHFCINNKLTHYIISKLKIIKMNKVLNQIQIAILSLSYSDSHLCFCNIMK